MKKQANKENRYCHGCKSTQLHINENEVARCLRCSREKKISHRSALKTPNVNSHSHKHDGLFDV